MAEHDNIVVKTLAKVPGFEGLQASECQITRLGGLTNLVHRVQARGQAVIVRIPGEGTESYINRATEMHNARAAEAAGVAPAVIWGDAVSGVMVTRCIEAIATMTPALFKSRQGALARAGVELAKLHRSGQVFEFRFELFAMIEDYLKILTTKDVALPDGYHGVVQAAQPIKSAFAAHPGTLAPSHCDPLCENFLDDGSRMWIVDWEYSGMNDPMWDLGDLSVEAEMSAEEEAELLHAYFGRAPNAAEQGRVVIYKAMCDLLWTLWGLIQHADANPAADFWAYANTRFDRCRALMNAPEFAGHLAAIKAG